MNDLQVEPSPTAGRAADRPAARRAAAGRVRRRDPGRRPGRGREGAVRLPRDRLMRVRRAAIVAGDARSPLADRQPQSAADPQPRSAIRSPRSAIRSRPPVHHRRQRGRRARPHRSTTSSRPISSCAKRARWCRSNRCGSSAPAAIRRPMPPALIADRGGRAPGRRQGRRAAVRDFPRRVSRRRAAPTPTRPRGAAAVSSIAT